MEEFWLALAAFFISVVALYKTKTKAPTSFRNKEAGNREEIITQSLKIINKKGKVSAILNGEGIALVDNVGMPRLNIVLGERGAPAIFFRKGMTGEVFSHWSFDNESGSIQLQLASGTSNPSQANLLLNIDREGVPVICLFDANNKARLGLCVPNNSQPSIDLIDQDGQRYKVGISNGEVLWGKV
jgi:hypothetical protein